MDPFYKTVLHQRLRETAEEWPESNQGVCCETVASRIFRNYTHKVSHHEMNKDANEHAKVNGGKPTRPQAYIRNYGQLK